MSIRFASCATLAAIACANDPVEVRACNRTGHDVTDFFYDVGPWPSEALANGACTAYRVAAGDVYRYTLVTFAIGTDRFVAQPIDYVGETPLGPGRWTYHVTLVDYERRVVDVHAVWDD